MTEHIRAEQLALYAGGDLAADQSRHVAAHLSQCALCRGELAEFREVLTFAAGAVRDPEPEDLAVVRKRVNAILQTDPGGRKVWAWWLAAAAGAVTLVVLAVGLRRPALVAPTAAPAVASSAPLHPARREVNSEVATTLASSARRKLPRSHRGAIRAVTLIARDGESPIIKIMTSDPNVIILWQPNERTMHE